MEEFAEAFAPQTILQRFQWGLHELMIRWSVAVILVVTAARLLGEAGVLR